MGSITNHAEDAFLGHLFISSETAPTSLFLALCTADPTDAATGASMNETADDNGYARTAITFGAAATRRVTQSADLSFPAATGNYAAPITHWAIVDSDTHGAGNAWATGAFSSPFQPVTGNTPRVLTALQEVYVQVDPSSGAGLSDYAANNLLDYFFRNQAFTSPAGSTFIRLSSTILDDQDVAVTDFTEVTGTGYGGVEVNPDGGAAPAWSAVSGGALSNADEVDFGTVGAGGWDEIVAMAIMDTISGAGNIIGFDSANVQDQTPSENDEVVFPAGQIDISIS